MLDQLSLSVAVPAGIGVLAAGMAVSGWLGRSSERLTKGLAEESAGTDQAARVIRALGRTFFGVAAPLKGLAAGLDRELTFAGRPHGGVGAQEYLAASMILSIAISAAVGAFFGFMKITSDGTTADAATALFRFVLFGAPVAFAYFLLDIRTTASRVAVEIEREFPFFLDLAILVVQAGGTPRQALAKYVEASPNTELAREIRITAKDADATSFEEGLLRMVERVKPSSVRAILKNLAQGEKSSGEVEQFYTDQAEELRYLREEMAARTAERLKANINLPVFLVMTSIIVAALAPTIVNIRAQGFF